MIDSLTRLVNLLLFLLQLSLEQVKISERPPEDTPMVRLQLNIANSLKSALAKQKAAQGNLMVSDV